MQNIFRHRWFVPTALILVLLVGLLVRLYKLTEPTIAHVEIYTPGIDLPQGISIPEPRFTIRDILVGVIFDQEPNPWGYYVLMLGWDKLFGTEVFWLRLPSVIFGIGSVLLVFCLAALEENQWTGLLAAGMLALNGHQIYWSQIAKMYIMGEFFGLLSTWMLLLAMRGSRNQRVFQTLYILATLSGLGTVVHFWFLFAVQILWVTGFSITRKEAMPGLLRLQILILILASPLISLALFQSRRLSYLDPHVLRQLVQYLQFGFLFEVDMNAPNLISIPAAASFLLLLLASILLFFGLRSNLNEKNPDWDIGENRGPSTLIMLGAGAIVSLIVLRLARFTYGVDASRTWLVVASGLLPLLLFIVDLLLRRLWSLIHMWGKAVPQRIPISRIHLSLIALLAIVPVVVILLISPVILLFASRTVMLFTPFLLIVLARGVVSLVQKNRLWGALIPALVIIFSLSAIYYRGLTLERPTDYKGLAVRWMPQIDDSDLIFIQPHWATTPIFYYLEADHYHLVGNDYSEEIRTHPNARIWVLSFTGLPVPSDVEEALNGYQVEKTLQALRIKATLYDK